MSTSNFPTSADSSVTLPNPSANTPTNNPTHAGLHTTENDAIKALESKVGTGATTPSANTVLRGTGTGTSAWGQMSSSQFAAILNDETGNGFSVFNNTPTLVTPQVDTINESTADNGVTVDGLNVRDGVLNTNNSVKTSNIQANAVTTAKIASGATLPTVMQNPYKFSVYLNTDTPIANTTMKVPFDTKDFDTSSNFDVVTNHRFTAPIAGFYQLSTQVQVGSSGMGTTEYGGILLYKNGSAYLFSQTQNGSGNADLIARPQINKLVQLNANDYIEIYFTFLGSRDITNGLSSTFFSGFLVSAT